MNDWNETTWTHNRNEHTADQCESKYDKNLKFTYMSTQLPPEESNHEQQLGI